ncbi:unnamed protein product [Schistocephalus solidus]|uniref:Cyclic nucleotide-binding domain-containing protein n=1 Tax=Schistocephalus solidus TaxID=70667 RepID=A0A183SGI2_SCHSO|nr:unnamed protein product [Schistocephalus solidus]
MSEQADLRTEGALPGRASWKGLGIGGVDPYSAKAVKVEAVELPRLLLVERTRFRSIQQRRQYDSFVHIEFGAEVETRQFNRRLRRDPPYAPRKGDAGTVTCA